MTPAPWLAPLTQAMSDRRRIWRESQRRRRAGKSLTRRAATARARNVHYGREK